MLINLYGLSITGEAADQVAMLTEVRALLNQHGYMLDGPVHVQIGIPEDELMSDIDWVDDDDLEVPLK